MRLRKRPDVTLDVAVVGGGLCGLALARSLVAQGLAIGVFEARARLGGRIESSHAVAGAPAPRVDLGPTWFWPSCQPLIRGLVQELGLRHFAQHDTAEVLVQSDPGEPARKVRIGAVHSSARRLAGGTYSLIEALASSLPAAQIHLEHVLTAVYRRSKHVELCFEHGDQVRIVCARRVVLALPPRLLAERVRFEPPLSAAVRTAMLDTPTWMATQAKVALSFERPYWRRAGFSGNAFVQHPQTLLKEIFDACEDRSELADGRATSLAALGAFVALPPSERQGLTSQPAGDRGLLARASEQVAQLFGAEPPMLQLYRDWAAEPYTCSSRDYHTHCADPAPAKHGASELLKARWDHRLYFGGSETAEIEGGYMEGALHAAQRITRELSRLEEGKSHAPRGIFHRLERQGTLHR
ncbi:MAG: FAD-dependent oxidoreductase [Polyangiales bacterium]